MANKKATKKKTTNKNTKKRVVKKTSVTPRKKVSAKKQEKPEVTKEEVTSKVVKDFVVLVIVIMGVFGLVYLLTVGAGKIGWFDQRYTAPSIEEANISYDIIEAGTMFNRSEENYYVVIGDFSTNNMYIDSLIGAYKEKEGAKKVYKVDLSNGINAFLKGEEAKTTSSNVNKLSINDFTLIEVKNGVNAYSVVGTDEIANILK